MQHANTKVETVEYGVADEQYAEQQRPGILECVDHGGPNTSQIFPVHPETDPNVGRLPHDPAKAKELWDAAGMTDVEIELHSIDDDWRRNTTDAIPPEDVQLPSVYVNYVVAVGGEP